ncbi:hypothetical protein AB0K48_49245 [Nonomuraea sp. NPDC055795]
MESEEEALRGQLDRLNAELDRQTDFLTRRIIPEDVYLRGRDRLLADRTTVLEAIDRLEVQPQRPAASEVVPVLEGLTQEWDTLAVMDRRRFLMEVIEAIQVWRNRLAPAKIVVTPRWEGGEPRMKVLPGRNRMDAVSTAVLKVLAEQFEGAARYGVLQWAVAMVEPSSKKVYNAAVLALTGEGLLVREPQRKQGTIYRLSHHHLGSESAVETGYPLSRLIRGVDGTDIELSTRWGEERIRPMHGLPIAGLLLVHNPVGVHRKDLLLIQRRPGPEDGDEHPNRQPEAAAEDGEEQVEYVIDRRR